MRMITIAWCDAKKGSASRNELEELETWLVTAEAPREKEQEDGPAWGTGKAASFDWEDRDSGRNPCRRTGGARQRTTDFQRNRKRKSRMP
jgi:hypothetical protein